MKRFVSSVSLLLLLLVLAGCGDDPANAPGTKVTGFASKGPIINGVIKIYSVVDGKKGELLAQTTTDASGNYTADIGSYTGPIIAEASGSYLDEATGTTQTISADAPLHAALPQARGTVNLPVTPLTELAVIEMGSAMTPEAISAANTLISDLFKVDIIATLPVAPTADALKDVNQAQKDYTLALAAVSQMIQNSAVTGGTGTLNDVLTTLGQGITSTGMTAATADAIQSALTTFVTSNPNNQTGVKDTSGTSLTNVGTLTRSYKLSLGGTFTPNSVTGLQFDLALPAGVTLYTNSSTSAVLASSLALTGTIPSGALLAAKYSAGVVTAGILSTSGLTAGEIATLTCNIAPGIAEPAVTAFSVASIRAVNAKGGSLSGVSVTVQ